MEQNSIIQIKTKYSDLDTAYINELLVKDVHEFDWIYKENSSYVYNACLGILGNCEDARDATQETFIQLHKSLSKINGKSTYRTWLYRVAVNKCMDMLRHRKKCAHSDSLEWLHDEHDSTDANLLEEHVRQSILKLKPQFRAVLVLYYFEQLSYSDIAESLNCSLVVVRTRLHRARKAFRLVFNDGGDNNEM